MLEWKKKTVLESLKDFLQNGQNMFSIFFFVFYWKQKENEPPPFTSPLSLHFGGVLVPLAP